MINTTGRCDGTCDSCGCPPAKEEARLSDAEFLSKRLARVARLAGVPMPDMSHEQIAEVAGTILGQIASKLEHSSCEATADGRLSDEQIRFRFFKDLVADQRLAVFKAFGVYPDNCTENLNHSIERRLLDTILSRRPAACSADGQSELYFLQDKRSYVGNCPMWWAKDGKGYTTRIDMAHRYTKEQAFAQHRSRETDIPWPCSVVEPLQRPTIDMQDLHKTEYFRTNLDSRPTGNGAA